MKASWKLPGTATLLQIAVFVLLLVGCSGQREGRDDDSDAASSTATVETTGARTSSTQQPARADDFGAEGSSDANRTASNASLPGANQFDPTQLLAAALTEQELEEGWIRLFDGQTTMGWFVEGNANWSIDDGVLRVDSGERSYFCTRFRLRDFELRIDFRAAPQTNSGIFLRSTPRPRDVASQCLELNIAPPDNPFPTGSFVQRQRVDPQRLGDFDSSQWHTYHVRLVDQRVEVELDGEPIVELEGFESAHAGHICLQHNSGRVEFRNIMLKPLGLTPLATDASWQNAWMKMVKPGAEMEVIGNDMGLRLIGGLGQLQSLDQFGDFVLQTRYVLARPDVNSGIFFRCVPDAMLDGYECQVNHAVIDGNPTRPADGGAGAIFRRQDARVVVGDGTSPTWLTLMASGPFIATWVNGIQVVEFEDTRPPHENPRRGLRLAPGPLALQGHDPTTDVTYQWLRVGALPSP